VTPIPKPARRVVDSRAGRAKVIREGRCRLCERTWYEAGGIASRHHLVPKGQGGDDVEANLIPVCGDGTTGCHGDLEHSVAARRKLRIKLHRDEIAYGVEKVGQGRFDRRYPPTEVAA
jgi:hypothetical protein